MEYFGTYTYIKYYIDGRKSVSNDHRYLWFDSVFPVQFHFML